MTRAEERALEIFPVKTVFNYGLTRNAYSERDANLDKRALFCMGYEQAEKDLINRIRKQVETWMPERDGDEHTEGERLAFRSVLHLLEELEDEK